jgi:acetyl-CoA C-acetyltransferase
MAQLLRENPGKRGMITANGGYITKHAFGIYSSEPPAQPFQHADLQDQVDAELKRDVVIEHQGTGTVEGYSVMYGPEGVSKAFVAARLADGQRAWGTSEDVDLLQSMTEEEFCGRSVNLANHEATF